LLQKTWPYNENTSVSVARQFEEDFYCSRSVLHDYRIAVSSFSISVDLILWSWW